MNLDALTLPEGAIPPPESRPVVGAAIAGKGGWVNPAYIIKVEVVAVGHAGHQVVAYLADPGARVQAGHHVLSPLYDNERDAQRACDAIMTSMFAAFVLPEVHGTHGGAIWPEPDAPHLQ